MLIPTPYHVVQFSDGRRVACSMQDHRRVDRLGRYNTERSRGLTHEKEWIEFMVEEQKWFDNERW